MLDTQIQVKLDHFDGPLALLLHLIQRDEVDIADFDLTVITRQYLDFLARMEQLNFDLAGEYLYLAATLIYLKSKECITEEDKQKLQEIGADHFGIFSKTDLIRRLEQLHSFQKLGAALWQLPKRDHEIFVKPKVKRKELVESTLPPMELEQLTLCMIDFFRRERRKFAMVRRDRISIKEKLLFLKSLLTVGETVEFSKMLDKNQGIDDIVITFISLLELARLKKISLFQNESQGEIYVKTKESLENFDVEVADGFDDPDEEPELDLVNLSEKQQENNNTLVH